MDTAQESFFMSRINVIHACSSTNGRIGVNEVKITDRKTLMRFLYQKTLSNQARHKHLLTRQTGTSEFYGLFQFIKCG